MRRYADSVALPPTLTLGEVDDLVTRITEVGSATVNGHTLHFSFEADDDWDLRGLIDDFTDQTLATYDIEYEATKGLIEDTGSVRDV